MSVNSRILGYLDYRSKERILLIIIITKIMNINNEK